LGRPILILRVRRKGKVWVILGEQLARNDNGCGGRLLGARVTCYAIPGLSKGRKTGTRGELEIKGSGERPDSVAVINTGRVHAGDVYSNGGGRSVFKDSQCSSGRRKGGQRVIERLKGLQDGQNNAGFPIPSAAVTKVWDLVNLGGETGEVHGMCTRVLPSKWWKGKGQRVGSGKAFKGNPGTQMEN